jgi:hypothetical protein
MENVTDRKMLKITTGSSEGKTRREQEIKKLERI